MQQTGLKTAFIGLGVMGYPMATHLLEQGYKVTVYNRTSSRAEQWIQQQAHHERASIATTPSEAADGADLVFTCVGNDNDLEQVTLASEGVIQTLKTGAILVDHTTASAQIAQKLHQACEEKQAGFIDAPVSGGQQGAENGQLTIMCGGNAEVFAKAAPVMKSYAKNITYMGETGAGQITKMVNQICVAGVLQGLAEGLSFAEQAGLDRNRVIDAISQGAAGSWQMSNRSSTMIADRYDHGFAVDWMCKDLDICLKTADQYHASLPITECIYNYYQEIRDMGGGRWDTSSLYKRMQGINKKEG